MPPKPRIEASHKGVGALGSLLTLPRLLLSKDYCVLTAGAVTYLSTQMNGYSLQLSLPSLAP